MNEEEEALIRTMIDHPSDDTARLVYADWLDERDDPRGAYLRAELEWVRTGQKERSLRTKGKKLDALWVYRVSRPPVGVCFRHSVFEFTGPTLQVDDIALDQMKQSLPTDYLAFLLNFNGGLLSDVAWSGSGAAVSWQIEGFSRLRESQADDDEAEEANSEVYPSEPEELPTFAGLSASLWHPNVSNTGWGGSSEPVFDDCIAIAFERADYGHFNVVLYRQFTRAKKAVTQILFYRDPNGDPNFYADAEDEDQAGDDSDSDIDGDEEEEDEEDDEERADRIAREFDAEEAAVIIADSFPAFLQLVDKPKLKDPNAK